MRRQPEVERTCPGQPSAKAVARHLCLPVRNLHDAAVPLDQSPHRIAAVPIALRAHELEEIEPPDQIAEGDGAVGGHGRSSGV